MKKHIDDRDKELQKQSVDHTPVEDIQGSARPEDGSRDELIELVKRAQGGDKDAFGQLFLRFKDKIYRHLVRYVRDRETAEDLWQDAFFKAWRCIPRLKEAARVESWLLMIASHLAIDYLRRLQLERRHHLSLDVEVRDYIDERADTEKETIDKEIIRKAFAELRPRLQKILLLSVIGFSAAEIAFFCQCKTPQVVATLLSGARKLLRQKISAYLAMDDDGA